MDVTRTSPRIVSIEWGAVHVQGMDGPFKDAKLFPGGAREWDWNETRTSHVPGVQPSDVEELLEHGAAHIVLSKGMHERLQVRPDTLELLRDRGIKVDILETNAAVGRYNELAGDKPVGALIHSTC